jgi:hypothetical protein
MTRISAIAAMAAVLPLAAAAASKGDPAKDGSAFTRAISECRKVADGTARLACYDAAAATLDEAQAKGEIVVIDRAQATAAHREAFGLPVPSLSILTKALAPSDVDRFEGVVETARADVSGHWTLWLEGGPVWRQIDGDLSRAPHPGSKVRIRHGVLGSFLMNVDDQPAVKAHRDQ